MLLLCKDRISQIIEKWYMLEPLYFSLWTSHELVLNSNMATLRSGNGRIEYNPVFIQSLDDESLERVLRFEAMRLLLKHPYQRRKPQTELTYQASNITVQEYLATALPIANAEQTFYCKDYNHLYFEKYYQILLEHQNKGSSSPEEKQSNSNNNESTPSSETSSSLDHYAQSPVAIENTETWEANEYHSYKINEKIEQAQQSRQWGSISGQLQQTLLASLTPKLNYRDMLKQFRASILSNHRCLTRMKPSRRYGFNYLGSRRDFNTQLLVAVDVSGSITNYDIQCAFSVINQLFKYGIETIDVIQFDTEIKGEVMQLTKARHQFEIEGRGGTDFQAPLDYIDEHRHYDGLIVFTDGYAPSPNPPQNRKTRLFWLFNHQKNYDDSKDLLQHLGRTGYVLT